MNKYTSKIILNGGIKLKILNGDKKRDGARREELLI